MYHTDVFNLNINIMIKLFLWNSSHDLKITIDHIWNIMPRKLAAANMCLPYWYWNAYRHFFYTCRACGFFERMYIAITPWRNDFFIVFAQRANKSPKKKLLILNDYISQMKCQIDRLLFWIEWVPIGFSKSGQTQCWHAKCNRCGFYLGQNKSRK